MADWLAANATAITIWCAALSTFAVYSVLHGENRVYRLFEHIFIGLATGYGVYIAWTQILGPQWWDQMVGAGRWYWAFAAVAGSMFFFMYSQKHLWISRVIFGLFMGLAAGGMFREFYVIYFRQIGSSMKPIAGPDMSIWATLNVLVFYVLLFASMSYFFFSFEHKNPALRGSARAGRWFLMIGFGAIFGATVMGRMTLFIGRFNFLVNRWAPLVGDAWSGWIFKVIVFALALGVLAYILRRFVTPKPKNPAES